MEFIIKSKRKIPVAPLMGFPGIQFTQTTIKDNLEDAKTQFNSLNMLYKKYRPDIMFPMMDLSVEAEVLGCEIYKPEDSSYTVVSHPLENIEDIEKFRLPNPQKSGRMPIVLDVINMMNNNINCLSVAYITGPFTLAGLLSNVTTLIKNVVKAPDFLNKIIKFVTKVNEIYGKALINAGADGICILEPTATGLAPDQFWKFSGKYIKKLRAAWNIPVTLHICGDSSHLIPKMIKTGSECLSFDSMVNLSTVIKEIPQNVFVMGNIDPVNVIAYGKKEDIKKEVRNLLSETKEFSNFILSSGCDLPPDTNLENINYLMHLSEELS